MRAVMLHAAHDVRVEHVARPVPRADEVLLRITAAGICGSDAFFYEHGPGSQDGSHIDRPIVLGHEFAGIVVETGSEVDTLTGGELVVSGAGISCGRCRPCRAGRPNLCHEYVTAGIHLDGGLAEYCAIPAAICEPTAPYGVTGDDAALAQPMSIAHHSVNRGRLQAGERALIVGVGGIGMFATWVASQLGAEVTAVDMAAERLQLAQRLGAVETVTLDESTLTETLGGGDAFDVIYEITGTPQRLAEACELARRGTRLVVVGVQKQPTLLDAARATIEELEIIGTAAHVRGVDLPAALRHLSARGEGWADVAPHALPLERIVDDGLIPLVERRSPSVKVLADPVITSKRPYGR